MLPPPYFEAIQRRAHALWDQLQANPELAGPWQLLFRQVQSPRHVVSELLQNADDANAHTAEAFIEGNRFVFVHDGDDFSEDQFASLCRFGYSNKRSLHTIGFRGIGFKSTFSLGAIVQITTPSLAVEFCSDRFTEPRWLETMIKDQRTWVCVDLEDEHRHKDLQKNFSDWTSTSLSLLFFKNITKLLVAGSILERKRIGSGPTPYSDRTRLAGNARADLLLFRSPNEEFPEDSLLEIRKERDTDELNLPPCNVEIVLGSAGPQRIYVVLPTGGALDLPFSCNGPFILTPDRVNVKTPSRSTTNRWLLSRVGQLAGQSILDWLGNDALGLKKRADAYSLLPSCGSQLDSAEHECTSKIVEQLISTISDSPLLLCKDGKLVQKENCLAIPQAISNVWSQEATVELFGQSGDCLLSEQVGQDARQKLSDWELLSTYTDREILDRLSDGTRPPMPEQNEGLLALWAFAEAACGSDFRSERRKQLMVVPVEGEQDLYSAEQVSRFPKECERLLPEDWEFLSRYSIAIRPEWLEYLNSHECQTTQTEDDPVENARAFLAAVGLHQPSSWDRIIKQVWARLSQTINSVRPEDLVQFTHIISALGLQVPNDFVYIARNENKIPIAKGVVLDIAGEIEALVPAAWADEHFLHDDYSKDFSSAQRRQAWIDWSCSDKSALYATLPLSKITSSVWSKPEASKQIKKLGGIPPDDFPYRGQNFDFDDYDYDQELIKQWDKKANRDQAPWHQLLRLTLLDQQHRWTLATLCSVHQYSGGRNYCKRIECGEIPAKWIRRFQSLKCLPDTYGNLACPAELLLRTPETEPLMGVERFVAPEFDSEANKGLLRMLGVRDTATGPDKLLQRIAVLATVTNPPISEVIKWYDALDRVLARARPEDWDMARSRFESENLVLTSEGAWASLGEVSLAGDDHTVPGAAVVHPSARDFSMWSRLGIAVRPSIERVIAWLAQLPDDKRLEPALLKRIKDAIASAPARIWNECQHWLNIEGSWVSTSTLDLQVSMHSLTRFLHLFPAVRTRTADLRMLPVDVCTQSPFATLKSLAGEITYELDESDRRDSHPVHQPWIETLASLLCRIRCEQDQDTQQFRDAGRRLKQVVWQIDSNLSAVPFVKGTPAGEAISPLVLWQNDTLYVKYDSMPRIFDELVNELARGLGFPQLTEPLRACVDRAATFITEYFSEHFQLDPVAIEVIDRSDSAALPVEQIAASTASQISPDSRSKDMTNSTLPVSPINGDNHTIDPLLSEQPTSSASINGASDSPESIETGTDATSMIQAAVLECQRREANESMSRVRLFQRFAAAAGYEWQEARHRFVHPDGSWLQRITGEEFNLEKYSANGEIICRYWASEQCLETSGVELSPALWESIKSNPEQSGLVLNGPNGDPYEYAGLVLLDLLSTGELKLFPGKYRIRRYRD